ncbi:hypothetical protein CDAR_435741 [Caerostris darwini]|uniref:Uncharacterized protein n=1 Tax=Caerostris darwini TaxID=1538125 RepID=A0AAV4PAR7_9ARAC|nr:hypothetical protein CDAR_435741 [Caerostris darwini]
MRWGVGCHGDGSRSAGCCSSLPSKSPADQCSPRNVAVDSPGWNDVILGCPKSTAEKKSFFYISLGWCRKGGRSNKKSSADLWHVKQMDESGR